MTSSSAHQHVRSKRLVLPMLCLLFFGSSAVHAQPVATVDLEISAELQPRGQLVPGTTARVILRFRNNGPDALQRVTAVSSSYNYGIGQQFALLASSPNPCPMVFEDFTGPPGTPVRLVAIISAGAVAPGSEAVCTLDVPISAGARGQAQLTFRALDGMAFLDDPNLANNEVALGLVFDPPLEVPALNAFLLVLLTVTMVAVATVRMQLNIA